MIGQWIRRAFGRTPRGAATPRPGTSRTPESTTPGADTAEQVDSPSNGASPITLDGAAELRRAVAAVRAEMSRSPHALNDAAALVTRLAAGPAEELRQIPAAANSIMKATRDLNVSREKIVPLIEKDPAIAQGLLKAANSVAFNPRGGTITSLRMALDRLGMSATRSVVLQQALTGLICRPGGDLDAMAEMVWTHMSDAAEIARIVAPSFEADPDEAFAATLLHDVGKLILFDACSALRRERRRGLEIPDETLSMLLRRLHEPLGAVAAESWSMSPALVRAIGSHHRSDAGAESDGLSEVVFFAERMDLARRTTSDPNFSTWWEEGALSASPEVVTALLEPVRAA